MRLLDYLPFLVTGVAANIFTPASTAETDRLAAQAFRNLQAYQQYDRPGGPNQSCTLENASVRREWDSFSPCEKKHYTDSVLCLMKKPSISGSLVPGARSRYDDFVATHINQTLSIHATGNFLSWHRYFTWAYEQALRNECNYMGHQPYLNWPRYALDLLNAPVFDGSPTSMSGNGAFDPSHNGTNIPSNDAPFIVLPPGRGGGCLFSGPFAKSVANLGPVAPILRTVPPNPRRDGFGYNPRCLRRDISAFAAKNWSTDMNVSSVITDYTTIGTFQDRVQGDFPAGYLGIHTAGHFFVGGDPGGDLFVSPGDPYFFLHHAQLDRVWWIWQNLDPKNRYQVIEGTLTLFNWPPSRNATLEDFIDMGVNAPGIQIKDAVDTLAGSPFCYIYQ